MIKLNGDSGLFHRLGMLVTDENFDFWTPVFMANAINEAARAIVRLRPDANYKRVNFACAPGALQALPEEAHLLMDVEGCVEDGVTTCAVKARSVHVMNEQVTDWRNAPPGKAQVFAYEENKPRQFWIYPRPPAGQVLSVVYSYFPTAINENSTTLDFPEVHEQDVINYCLYRCWVREGTQGSTAQYWRTVFYEGLNIKLQADKAHHPQDRHEPDNRDRLRSRG